ISKLLDSDVIVNITQLDKMPIPHTTKFCDIVVRSNDTKVTYPAHRILMSRASPVLHHLLVQPMPDDNKLQIDVSGDMLIPFLKWIDTGSLHRDETWSL